MTLVNTFGFSVVTFDGAVGGPIEPRTSSSAFHMEEQDHRMVEELRAWADSEGIRPLVPTIPLSKVQPKMFFDLTCQLLAKAPIDSSCTLLRVRTAEELQPSLCLEDKKFEYVAVSANVDANSH